MKRSIKRFTPISSALSIGSALLVSLSLLGCGGRGETLTSNDSSRTRNAGDRAVERSDAGNGRGNRIAGGRRSSIDVDPTGGSGRAGGPISPSAPNRSDDSTLTSTAGDDGYDRRLSVGVYFSQVGESFEMNRRNPENLAAKLSLLIDSAKRTVDLCCYEIDEDRIIDAAVRARDRGVRVRVVTDADFTDEDGPKTFKRFGVPVVFDDRDDLMHDKFVIVDERIVWTGSANFTRNDCYRNDNNAVAFVSVEAAKAFGEKFHWFFERKGFGGRPDSRSRIPFTRTVLADGTPVDFAFSPHDGVDRIVIDEIRNAKSSIAIMMFSFTHAEIADALVKAAERGVRVSAVLESRQLSRFSQFERLAGRRGIDVRRDGNDGQMHHKAMVIDGAVVITGSYNFSAGATHSNDENIVVIRHRQVAGRFLDEFDRVRRQTELNAARANPDEPNRR